MSRPSTRQGQAPGVGDIYPLRLRVAVCAVCGGPIHVEVADPRQVADRSAVHRQRTAAISEHAQTHPSAVLARYRARRWPEQDRRACYTIDEALGSLATYRLWLAAHRRRAG